MLVLPAHNAPFTGLHERIDQLIQSHLDGLVRLQELLSEPRRTKDVFAALFARPITPGVLILATGEASAHLNHLAHTGRATSAIEDAAVLSRCLDGVDADGVAAAFRRYEATRKPRTSKIQMTSAQNTWLRGATDADWVYGYDAWTTPLAAAGDGREGAGLDTAAN